WPFGDSYYRRTTAQAWSGKPANPADVSCFLDDFGGALNNCGGGERRWVMPFPFSYVQVPFGQTDNLCIQVRGTRPTNISTGCTGEIIYGDWVSRYYTARQNFPLPNVQQQLLFTMPIYYSASVPKIAPSMICDVGSGARIDSYDYRILQNTACVAF
ncbi:MAG: hypothetical protein KF819_41115, partial [Labilithrix sp.]|nr:hypothetical protein [Labilithrix sp.]